uniref:Uncharacterized protein n=1 Tax=Rhizophora mucronata TaxID=61149 RepID=A0A2P2NP87_RHIMU
MNVERYLILLNGTMDDCSYFMLHCTRYDSRFMHCIAGSWSSTLH